MATVAVKAVTAMMAATLLMVAKTVVGKALQVPAIRTVSQPQVAAQRHLTQPLQACLAPLASLVYASPHSRAPRPWATGNVGRPAAVAMTAPTAPPSEG